MAASYYGRPRTTIDVDFIVRVSTDDLDKLLDHLDQAGLKINRTRIKRQLGGGYNIVSLQDRRSSNHVDLIIETEGKLERRRGRALGLWSYYQPPELLILSKLRMIRATRPVERSFKDREDIMAILENTRVNRRRIIEHARKEGTLEIFKGILRAERAARTSQSPRNQ